jgi:hypothetical protein
VDAVVELRPHPAISNELEPADQVRAFDGCHAADTLECVAYGRGRSEEPYGTETDRKHHSSPGLAGIQPASEEVQPAVERCARRGQGPHRPAEVPVAEGVQGYHALERRPVEHDALRVYLAW